MTRSVSIGSLEIGPGRPLCLIAGPCVIESRDHALEMAQRIREMAEALHLPFVFKASFDKANRTSLHSYRGPGLERGLEILQEVRERADVRVLTDIHGPEQAAPAAQVVDVLQIPAYLCRQTDLLLAAGETGRPVNLKKGQFLAPEDMGHAADKVASTGNQNILVTERGTCFGYHNLVVDMRSLVKMREWGYPVVFDATHSVQLPGGGSGKSAGERQFVFPLARAAAAVGIDALFVETHDDPDRALSDGPNMVPLKDLAALLRSVLAVHRAVAGADGPETNYGV